MSVPSSPRFPFLNLSTVNAPFIDEIHKRVAKVIDSGRYVGGEEVKLLEESLCRLTGYDYAIGVSNGLDALRLILRGYIELGLMSPGDEIIVPANTYVASILAISDSGLIPITVEPSAVTSNLDSSLLSQALSPKTKGIMTVHLYGRVAWDEELSRFARENNLRVIEDNAQAIGAAIVTADGNHRRTGGLGDAAAFSFYPTKNIGAMGDAGAVTTNDAQLAEVVRALSNYGSDRRYHNLYKGLNCRLDPIQAAVINVKLPYLDSENALRREVAEIYLSEIDNDKITLPSRPADPLEMVWHQFVVHTPDRARFINHLRDNSVGYDIHYATPPHRQPCYQGILEADRPITDNLAETCVSLPVTRCTSPDDAREIAAIINRY